MLDVRKETEQFEDYSNVQTDKERYNEVMKEIENEIDRKGKVDYTERW